MYTDPNELRRNRAKIVERMRAMLDKAAAEKRALTAQEAEEYDRLDAEVTGLGKTVDVLERQRARELEMASPIPSPDTTGGGMVRSLQPGEVRYLTRSDRLADHVGVNADAERLHLGRFVRGLISGDWRGAELERRAMTEGTLSEGGYAVPVSLAAEIIDAARNQSAVFGAGARTIAMDSQTLRFARVAQDLTVGGWKLEEGSVMGGDMALDAVDLKAKTLASRLDLSVELAEDAQGLDEVIRRSFAEQFALELDRAALLGSGADPEPRGIVNTVGVQLQEMATNGDQIDSYDPFSRAHEAVLAANARPTAWIYNSRTWGAIDRLKEATTDAPLGAPASFLSVPKFITEQIGVNMTHGSATNASAAFTGDFANVLVGVRTPFRLEVSRTTYEAWGSLGVSLRAYLRADIGIARPNQMVVITGIIP
jgi:HK97 family phage major capsid protein